LVSCNLDSESPVYKHGAAEDKSPDARIEADLDTVASSLDASQTAQKCSAPDEDVNDEIVDDPNLISEVKLPDKAR
jgi:hypothetical protein